MQPVKICILSLHIVFPDFQNLGTFLLTHVSHTYSYGQSLTYVWLLNKPYENEVALREQNIPLKCCQPLDFLYDF